MLILRFTMHHIEYTVDFYWLSQGTYDMIHDQDGFFYQRSSNWLVIKTVTQKPRDDSFLLESAYQDYAFLSVSISTSAHVCARACMCVCPSVRPSVHLSLSLSLSLSLLGQITSQLLQSILRGHIDMNFLKRIGMSLPKEPM